MKKLIAYITTHLSFIYKVCALVVTVSLILIMFPLNDRSSSYSYDAGSFWAYEDLYAPCDFAVGKTASDIGREKEAARKQAYLYFTLDSSALDTTYSRIEHSDLSYAEKQRLHRMAKEAYRRGVLEPTEEVGELDQHTLILLAGNVGSEHQASDFVRLDEVEEALAPLLQPNVRYDAVRTQLELDSRLSQINYVSHMVQKGELVVKQGEYLDEDKVLEIDALVQMANEQTAEHFNPVGHYTGCFLLCVIAFVALYFFLKNTNHSILEDDRKVTFVFLTVLLMAGITALVERVNPAWILIAPVCIVPILMRVFFDMRVALYIHLTVVIILGNLVPNSFEFIFYQLITGIMSLVMVREFENRRDFFTVALTIFVTYSFIYTAGILQQDTTLATINPERYFLFFLNALLTLLSYPLIYLFEKLFGMTTALTLMELSSTNTPVLRKLSHTAPGTFQHSMQVANIAEDIISEIGGNALLARVGGLYHDIGKTEAPIYFTENQSSGYNPHADLDLEESAYIITSHVRDGLKLARRYRLPSDVQDFIRTHHGTTHTGYFYIQWKQQHPGQDVDEQTFTYAGPRPFSRETAVVMMVDSAEAATKSLKEPTRESIAKMVNSVIDSKLDEHQLDLCDITFGDLSRIRELLVEKLCSVHHVRISYPTTKP